MGYEGYGIYWAIIELLYKSDTNELQTYYERIGHILKISPKKIKKVVENYQLFDKNSNFFWSNSVKIRTEKIQEKSEKARLSISKRWSSDTNVLRTNKKRIYEYDKNVHTIKEKENIKENKIDKSILQKSQLLDLEILKKQCLENQVWIEATCMGLQIPLVELPKRIDAFCNKLVSTGNGDKRTLQDFQSYFFNSEKFNTGKNPEQPQKRKIEIC